MENKAKRLVIAGAGGHAKVVADAVKKQGLYHLAGFLDDKIPIGTDVIFGVKVIGTLGAKELEAFADFFIVAIGNNKTRSAIYSELIKKIKPATVVHPASVIAENVNIGPGCVLLAGSVIGNDVTLGANSIVNALALVDHDSTIGIHSHIAQGAIVGSLVTLPSFYHVELGERIPSYTKIT